MSKQYIFMGIYTCWFLKSDKHSLSNKRLSLRRGWSGGLPQQILKIYEDALSEMFKSGN